MSFKLLTILVLCAYSNCSIIESEESCKGNILCRNRGPDHPQEEINNSDHQRVRRSSSDPCESFTEEIPFKNAVPDAPRTLLNALLTHKINQTRCVNEGAKCLQTLSLLEGRSFICQTKYTSRTFTFMTEANKTDEVYGRVKIGCDCVYE